MLSRIVFSYFRFSRREYVLLLPAAEPPTSRSFIPGSEERRINAQGRLAAALPHLKIAAGDLRRQRGARTHTRKAQQSLPTFSVRRTERL